MADWSLDKAVANWIEHRKNRVAAGSLKSEHASLRRFIEIFGPGMKLRSLADPAKIRNYQNARRAGGISAKTVNNEVQSARGILKLAQLWQRVECHDEPLRVIKSDLPAALTNDERLALLSAAYKADACSVVPFAATLAFATGMRRGEILGLQHRDLHHHDNPPYLAVRRANTKTDAGARRVVLDHIGVWAIQRLVARAVQLGSHLPEQYLLPTDRARHTRRSDPLRGKGFDACHPQSSWDTEWHQFRNVAGIGARRFHDLRHTYVTRAAEDGIPIPVTQQHVGHMSCAMIAHYTHVSHQAQWKAACEMDRKHPELLACLGLLPADI
jgi:integrase